MQSLKTHSKNNRFLRERKEEIMTVEQFKRIIKLTDLKADEKEQCKES